jgi:hypothetical protein
MQLWRKLEFVHVGEHTDIDGEAIGLMPLMKNLLAKDTGHLTEYKKEGSVKTELVADLDKDDENFDNKFGQGLNIKYSSYFTEKGGRLLHKTLGQAGNEYIFMWKDGLIDLRISGGYVDVRVMSENEKFVRETEAYFDEQWAEPERTGHIYAITKYGSQLTLSSLGNAGIPLIVENYTPKVMEDYRYVIKDLQSESPSGRITIMRGFPGTGKSYLIRATLLEVSDAMFVLVSPNMVQDLAGPELLPLLLSYRGGLSGPIILILEDADKCLVKRDENKENMNSIQSLLNLGDGILGSMLDLRIIATTNAQELHMEEALVRKGRLSRMLEVGPLDPKTAQKIFTRLCPGKNFPVQLNGSTNPKDFKVTLADVYGLARDNGWAPKSRKIKPDDDDMGYAD